MTDALLDALDRMRNTGPEYDGSCPTTARWRPRRSSGGDRALLIAADRYRRRLSAPHQD